MALAWGSVGLDVDARRISGPFRTKWIDPVGSPGPWDYTSWNFHHIGWYSNVFDPCIRVNEGNPRVPQDENINDPYKTDLYRLGTWAPQTAFHLGQTDPFHQMLSEVD